MTTDPNHKKMFQRLKLTGLFLLLLLLGAGPLAAQADFINAGPMPGHSAMREVTVWLQTTRAAEVRMQFWPEGEPERKGWSNTVNTQQESAFTAHLVAQGLEPGTTYQYRIHLDGQEAVRPYPTRFQTQTLWEYRTEPPAFTLLTGSCAYVNEAAYDRPGIPYGGDYEIFKAAAKAAPDLVLWLGDNVYFREADWDSRSGILARYTHDRATDELQPLLGACHHYAIWDDHDYGPNDSDRTYTFKRETLEAFQLFWANPTYGLGDGQGVSSYFQWQDIDFFLLDNRWFRDPNDLPGQGKTLLGREQLDWLKGALVSSRAPFKIVAIGGQVLNDSGQFETYANNGFGQERQELLDFIRDNRVAGVVFLTGDRHHTELSKLEGEGQAPAIYDLTVSPFTSGVSTFGQEEANSLRVPGTLVMQKNFAQIRFEGPRLDRSMTIAIKGKQGEVLWE